MSEKFVGLDKYKYHEQLVLLLSRAALDELMVSYVQMLLKRSDIDWDTFMGIAINHRVNGVVFCNINKYGFQEIPGKVILGLNLLYLSQKERNKQHQIEINKLFNELENKKIKYAFLKGAVLNALYYQEGERISNDTDIMIQTTELKKISEVLEGQGYIQGEDDGEKIIPASKKEIVFKRINTYEIVPYVKATDSDFLKYHYVDINFKLSNNEKTGYSDILTEETEIWEYQGRKIRTMDKESFLLFLCNHLYREATMIYKIVDGGDLALYKFMDIHFYILKEKSTINFNKLYEMALRINKVKDVYYAIFFTEALYPGTVNKEILKLFETDDIEYLDEYKGKDNSDEVYQWEMSFEERIFNCARKQEAMKNIEAESNRFERISNELKK